jgi:hypothetical protein
MPADKSIHLFKGFNAVLRSVSFALYQSLLGQSQRKKGLFSRRRINRGTTSIMQETCTLINLNAVNGVAYYISAIGYKVIRYFAKCRDFSAPVLSKK